MLRFNSIAEFLLLLTINKLKEFIGFNFTKRLLMYSQKNYWKELRIHFSLYIYF